MTHRDVHILMYTTFAFITLCDKRGIADVINKDLDMERLSWIIWVILM